MALEQYEVCLTIPARNTRSDRVSNGLGRGVIWKVIRTSVIGTSHVDSRSPCQDECYADVTTACDGSQYLICVVADGAGSASQSERGAELACSTIRRSVETSLSDQACNPIVDQTVVKWVKNVRRQIYQAAAEDALVVREFACTLIGAVVGPSRSVFFQIGDGSIVAKKNDIAGVVFWPDSGPYVNTTYFVTDEDALDRLQLTIVDAAFDEVALFSDGIQRIALSFDSQVPYWPFFEPMFKILRGRHGDACAPLDNELSRFLGSPEVNKRTDDDKTLILATRLRHE